MCIDYLASGKVGEWKGVISDSDENILNVESMQLLVLFAVALPLLLGLLYFFQPMMSPQKLEKLLMKAVYKDNHSIMIFSHGGVSTNDLANYFEEIGMKSRSATWGEIMHSPYPITLSHLKPNKFKAALYIYGRPLVSICSQKRRWIASENLRKITLASWFNYYTDKKMMMGIYQQFKAWTNVSYDNSVGYLIIRVYYEDLIHPLCLKHIFDKLGVSMMTVPRRRPVQRNSNVEACPQTLRLDQMHLELAKEIDAYNGSECEGIIPRDVIQWF